MALRKALVDPFTRSVLARSGLEELSRNLWPRGCMSCGEDLAGVTPSVLVVDEAVSVTASLHHPDCQVPRWTRHSPGLVDRHRSTAVSLLRVPFGNPARDPFLPTMLVNPSLEQVAMAPHDDGRYHATTVASYQPLGLRVPDGGIPRSDSTEICSWITDDALIVRCDRQVWRVAVNPQHPWIEDIRRRGDVVLGISTALHPWEMTNPEPIKRVLRDGDLATIAAPLNTTVPAPALTAVGGVVVDSDLADADEHNDVDWLPSMSYFDGPTYDPTTGRYEIGTSMDGPSYWELNTPGHGVENGLIVGPPAIGKTNALRVLLLEAAASGLFCVLAADPSDRNGWAELLAGRTIIEPARTRPETARLFEAVVAMIDQRADHAEQCRYPTPTSPGIVVGLDDAHEVLVDPATSALATEIATRGPAVSVGLVVVTESLELKHFAHRHDLVRALIKNRTNAVAFGGQTYAEQLVKLQRTELA